MIKESAMHLTDCFIELITYIVYFQKTVTGKQPPYEQVKADVVRLLTQSETCLKAGHFSQEDYDQARFMICAWVDEVILSSPWNHKDQWQREQLQRIYYNTTDAGEEVFERLNGLGLHQRDVREVYYICLALGFMGRYCKKGDEYLLEQLRASNLKILTGSSVGVPALERTELFPEGRPSEFVEKGPKRRRFRFTAPVIIGLAGPVVLFALLLIIYHFILDGIGENFFRTMP